jgi:short-subunit dehydrogenase
MDTTRRKVALVTGASAGLGAEFARQLAAAGHDVVLVARRLDRLEALAQALIAAHGIKAYAVSADLAQADAHRVVMHAVAARNRSVDILINNAGFTIPDHFARAEWQRESDMIMTLVYAVCSLTRAALPHMLAQGWGRIINVASVSGFAPGIAGHTLCPAAKSFVIKFSQSLDCEVRRRGVYVTAFCPGYTRTEFHAASGMADLVAKAPRHFGAEPPEVVSVALAANAAGRVIIVTGLRNRVRRLALKILPETITRPIINAGAARYRRND